MKRVFFVIAMLLLPLAFAHAAEQPEKRFTAKVGANGVQWVEILGGSYFFAPKHIVVKVNVPVALSVRKEPGMAPHNIVMAAPEAGMAFDEALYAKATTIIFTPSKAGIYPFYCTKRFIFYPDHRSQGMEGAIEVVE